MFLELLASDIVENRSALVDIRGKSIGFQHEMRKCRRLSLSLPRIEQGGINHA